MMSINKAGEFAQINFALPDGQREKDVIAWEAEQTAIANKRRFENVGFKEQYENMCFDAYVCESELQKSCKQRGERFAHKVVEGNFCNIVLEGSCGSGKTTLLACIANEVVSYENNRYGYKETFGMCNHYTASYHKSAEVSEKFTKAQSFSAKKDFERTLMDDFSTDLVIIDEVGTGGAREQDALFELIDWCSRKRLCMAFATNLNNTAFSDLLGARSCSRLRGITTIIEFTGIPDQRAKYNRLR